MQLFLIRIFRVYVTQKGEDKKGKERKGGKREEGKDRGVLLNKYLAQRPCGAYNVSFGIGSDFPGASDITPGVGGVLGTTIFLIMSSIFG